VFGLQFVKEARDSRGFLNHAVGNLEGRRALLAGTTQDAQHVVLLQGNAVRFHQLGEAPLQEVRGAGTGPRWLPGPATRTGLFCRNLFAQAKPLWAMGRHPYVTIG